MILIFVEDVQQVLQLPLGVVLLLPIPEQQSFFVTNFEVQVFAGGLVENVGKLSAGLDILEKLL